MESKGLSIQYIVHLYFTILHECYLQMKAIVCCIATMERYGTSLKTTKLLNQVEQKSLKGKKGSGSSGSSSASSSGSTKSSTPSTASSASTASTPHCYQIWKSSCNCPQCQSPMARVGLAWLGWEPKPKNRNRQNKLKKQNR